MHGSAFYVRLFEFQMKMTPQTDEGWESFWLITLGTLVLGISICYSQFETQWLAMRALGELIAVVFLLATAALGICCLVLIYRGRILLALIGFIIFAIGVLFNMPTL
jgi:predicted Abi (CAAX) family protease